MRYFFIYLAFVFEILGKFYSYIISNVISELYMCFEILEKGMFEKGMLSLFLINIIQVFN